jgi:hypothetical protein
LGGQRLVETADGLFGADEVQPEDDEDEVSIPLQSQGGVESHARAWLRGDVGQAQLPPELLAVQAAKDAAAQLFKDQKFTEARQTTTAAIRALSHLATRLVATTSAHSQEIVDDHEEQSDDDDNSHGDDGKCKEVHGLPTSTQVESLMGLLHSNRSLLITQLIQSGDQEVLAFGIEAAWRLVIDDADIALRADPLNFKASFRRARAHFELGELNEALNDATRVVDHYAQNSVTPNPEAAALRDSILETVRKERSKWGEKGRARWNRASNEALVTEIGGSIETLDNVSASSNSRGSNSTPQIQPAKLQRLAAAVTKPLAAPKTGADVEKALLVALKGNASGRVAYVRDHLSAVAFRRFFRRAPLGPDLLAALVESLGELAKEDAQAATERLVALADAPSARTHSAMFDEREQAALQQVLERAGPEAARAWAPAAEEAAVGGG